MSKIPTRKGEKEQEGCVLEVKKHRSKMRTAKS